MNIQYKDAMLHPVVALIMVVMLIQSAFQTVVFSKRKTLYSEIQIMFDQALLIFLQTQTLFLR